ncbi:MAG TPA: sodium-dependent transporter, partial [Thermoplasmatales archaeon]|nr:sodium-dependent transporter [Thermoplasmatales archaeon]
FGIMFYIALLTFGIDSAFSMIEPITAGVNIKWKISKTKSTAIICSLGFFASLIFTTGSGLHWLDIVDHFIANFGLVIIGLIECIVFGYLYKLHRLREHANTVSDIRIGRWWDALIRFIVPAVLITLLVVSLLENITKTYMGYPTWAIIAGGITPFLTILIISIILMQKRGK